MNDLHLLQASKIDFEDPWAHTLQDLGVISIWSLHKPSSDLSNLFGFNAARLWQLSLPADIQSSTQPEHCALAIPKMVIFTFLQFHPYIIQRFSSRAEEYLLCGPYLAPHRGDSGRTGIIQIFAVHL